MQLKDNHANKSLRRTVNVKIRLFPDEYKQLKLLAQGYSMSMSAYIRKSALKETKANSTAVLAGQLCRLFIKLCNIEKDISSRTKIYQSNMRELRAFIVKTEKLFERIK